MEKRSTRRWSYLEKRFRLEIVVKFYKISLIFINIQIYVYVTRNDIMSEGLDGIIDISSKPKVKRSAIATGLSKLNNESIDLIEFGRTSKGDVREASTVAVIQAVKDTPRMIPHCHTIPIEGCNVKWDTEEGHLRCTVSVISHWNTGVEMEALTAVSVSCLTMLKSNEKNIDGQYPNTKIVDIKILEKNKEQPHN